MPAFFTNPKRVYNRAISVNVAIVKKVIPVAVPEEPREMVVMIETNPKYSIAKVQEKRAASLYNSYMGCNVLIYTLEGYTPFSSRIHNMTQKCT